MLKVFNVVSLSDKDILPEEILEVLSKAFVSDEKDSEVFFTVTESNKARGEEGNAVK